MAADDTAKPRQSTGGVRGSREAGTARATSSATTAAAAAMKAKMLPHQKRSSSQPPAMGPVAIPTPVAAPHSPMALARSPRSVKTFTSSDRVEGNMRAAPSPITARAAMSSLVVPASAPASAARREDAQAGQQHALAALAVAQAARRQHQGREHQAVGIDHPLQLGGSGAERADQGGQGDVHDRDVDADQEGAQAKGQHDSQPPPGREPGLHPSAPVERAR